jgi:hypothetical protein
MTTIINPESYIIKTAREFKQNPNLGPDSIIQSHGTDDATDAFFVQVNSIISGEISMPFLHVIFLLEFFKGRNEEIYNKLKVIADLTRLRQFALARCINYFLNEKVVAPHLITKELENLDRDSYLVYEKAKELNININRFVNINHDDIEQSTNDWNLKQNDVRGSAADFVLVIQDVIGDYYIAVIERAFGPGRGEAAWPGGFVDKVDTFMETFNSKLVFAKAAERENTEETSHILIASSNVTVTTEDGVFPIFISPYTKSMSLQKDQIGEIGHWDVRGKFAKCGMMNGGKWRFVKYAM